MRMYCNVCRSFKNIKPESILSEDLGKPKRPGDEGPVVGLIGTCPDCGSAQSALLPIYRCSQEEVREIREAYKNGLPEQHIVGTKYGYDLKVPESVIQYE